MAAFLRILLLLSRSVYPQSVFETSHTINWIESNASCPLLIENSIHLYYDDHFIMFGGSTKPLKPNSDDSIDKIYIGTVQDTPTDSSPTTPSPTPYYDYKYTTKIVDWTSNHSIDHENYFFSWNVPRFGCESQCSSTNGHETFFMTGYAPPCWFDDNTIQYIDHFLYRFDAYQLIYEDRVVFDRYNLTDYYFNETLYNLTQCPWNTRGHPCVATNPQNFDETQTVYIVIGNSIFVYNISSETGYFTDSFTAEEWSCDKNGTNCNVYEQIYHMDQSACVFDETGAYIWITDSVGHLWRYDVDNNETIDVAAYTVDRQTGKPRINGTLNKFYDDGTFNRVFYYYSWDTRHPRMIRLTHGFIMVTGGRRDYILLPNMTQVENPEEFTQTKTKYIDIVCAGRRHDVYHDWVGQNTPLFLSWPSLNVISLGGHIFPWFGYVEKSCDEEWDDDQCEYEGDAYWKVIYNETLSTQIRTYSWLRDFNLVINFTEKILFGDNIHFNIYFEPTCDLYSYGTHIFWNAIDFNPFLFEIQIIVKDESIDIASYMYIINATDRGLHDRKDWVTTVSHCYLCTEPHSFNATESNIVPDGCSLCVDGLELGSIKKDEAGKYFEIDFEVLQSPEYGMFTLDTTNRFLISECDPGYGTTDGAKNVDCNRCPFNQFTLQQALEPCIPCDVSEGLLCEGGNETHLTYNYWVAAWDYNKGESGDLKPFYDIQKYYNTSVKDDRIITALCPPKYCCQVVSGCDYLSEYLNRPLNRNDSYDTDTGDVDISANGLLCAYGRDITVPLCGACLPGWSELLGTTQCGTCGWGSWAVIVWYSFVFAMLITWYIIFYDSKPIAFKQLKTKKEIMIQDDITGFQTLLFKPILYYFQSVSPILDTRGIRLWISPVISFFNFSFDTISGSGMGICWSSGLEACGEILINLLLPAALLIHLVLPRCCIDKEGYGSKPCCCCFKKKKICCCCCPSYSTPYFASAFFRVLLITIGVVLTVCFKYLTYVEIENKKLLFYSADKEAFNGWWFGGFFGVLFVIIVFVVIYLKIKKQEATQRYSTNSIYRKFVKSFKEEYWYWEFVLFSRRFFVSCFSSIQFVGKGYTNFIFSVILIIYLILQIHYKPFAYSRVNKIEALCLVLLMSSFIAANFIDIDDKDLFVGWILSLCILIPLIILTFYALKIILHRMQWISYDPQHKPMNTKVAIILKRMPKSFRDINRKQKALKGSAALTTGETQLADTLDNNTQIQDAVHRDIETGNEAGTADEVKEDDDSTELVLQSETNESAEEMIQQKQTDNENMELDEEETVVENEERIDNKETDQVTYDPDDHPSTREDN